MSNARRRRKVELLVQWVLYNVAGAYIDKHVRMIFKDSVLSEYRGRTNKYINTFYLSDGQRYDIRLIRNIWVVLKGNNIVLRDPRESAVQAYLKTLGLILPKQEDKFKQLANLADKYFLSGTTWQSGWAVQHKAYKRNIRCIEQEMHMPVKK